MQITKNFVVKRKFVAMLEPLVRQKRGEIRRKASEAKCSLRLWVVTGNRKGAIPSGKQFRDAALRITAGGIGRDFLAGFRANMQDGTIIVNINQLIFTAMLFE